MRMAPHHLVAAAVLAWSFVVSAESPISDVTLRRLSPWSGLMEVSYNLDADVVGSQPDSVLATMVRIRDHGTNVVEHQLIPSAWRTRGRHRWIWNAPAEDCQLLSTNLAAQVEIVESIPANTYCVVDLQTHGVSYLSEPPAGGWTDEYRTTKLAMRLINPGTFTMGDQVHGGDHVANITISEPYYLGIFEVTCRQYAWMSGNGGGQPAEDDCLPYVGASYLELRDRALDIHDQQLPLDEPDEDTVLADFRESTGLDFDLPTEAQWEYACRAGTDSDYANGSNYVNLADSSGLNQLGFCNGNSSFLEPVGSLQPNPWGLYDMHGNVQELCRDWYAEYLLDWVVPGSSDPLGPPGNIDGCYYSEWWLVAKGGSYENLAGDCSSWSRWYVTASGEDITGFRLMCPAVAADAGEEIIRASATSPSVSADLRTSDFVLVGEEPVRVELGPWTLSDLSAAGSWSVRLSVDGVERLETNEVTSLEFNAAWPSNVLSMVVLVDGEPRGAPLAMTLVSTNDPHAFSWARVLNAPALEFTTGGTGGWGHDTVTNHDGVVSMRSHGTGDDGSTWVETVVEGEGTLSFWCKVSGEGYRIKNRFEYYDYLSLTVDDESEPRWQGFEDDWTNVVIQIAGSGPHTLRWCYCKDEEGAVGDDCAWLDQVDWSGAVPGGATATSTTAVPVPYVWLERYYPGVVDYEACAHALCANGRDTVEAAYVAGFNPTDATAAFRAFIHMENGEPKITWAPDLNENGTRAERVYTIWGTSSLTPPNWHSPVDSQDRFFKVKVQMP